MKVPCPRVSGSLPTTNSYFEALPSLAPGTCCWCEQGTSVPLWGLVCFSKAGPYPGIPQALPGPHPAPNLLPQTQVFALLTPRHRFTPPLALSLLFTKLLIILCLFVLFFRSFVPLEPYPLQIYPIPDLTESFMESCSLGARVPPKHPKQCFLHPRSSNLDLNVLSSI